MTNYAVAIDLINPNKNNTGIADKFLDMEWDYILETYIKPAYDYGFRYVILRNPFDGYPEKNQSFDSRMDRLEKSSNNTLLFVSIQNFLEKVKKQCPGLRLNIQMGTLDDVDFTSRVERDSFAAWINRAYRSLSAFLNSDVVDITFTTGATYEANTPQYSFVRLIESFKLIQSNNVFVTPVANKTNTATQSFRSLITVAEWNEHIEKENPWRVIDRSGQIYMYWDKNTPGNNDYADDMLLWAKRIVDMGLVPVFDFNQFFTNKGIYTAPPAELYRDLTNLKNYTPGQFSPKEPTPIPPKGEPVEPPKGTSEIFPDKEDKRRE